MSQYSVAVFCGSSPGGVRAPDYLGLARDFGRMLAEAGMICVNGGSCGMMTALSEGAHAGGGCVKCICLSEFPPDHVFYTDMELHPYLAVRQHALIQDRQAYVALPGGYGTIFEVMDVMSRKALGEIPEHYPLICVGSEEFTDLKRLVAGIYRRRFSPHDPFHLMKFVATPEAAMELLIAARGAG